MADQLGGGGSPAEPSKTPTEQARVLIVEDDDATRNMVSWILLTNGFAVTTAESTLGAVPLARNWHPDLILLDIALPFRSGASLLDSLREDPQTATIPVVVVSGFPQVLDALDVERRALVASVLKKPFTASALLHTVHSALGLPAQHG